MAVIGRVVATGAGGCRVRLDEEGGEVEASVRGRLKDRRRGGSPVVVGDRVRVALADDEAATVEEVLPRDSEVVRRGFRGRRPKVLAANVDGVVAVASIREPVVPPEVVDRLLVVAEANRLSAVLAVNKVDLVTEQEARRWAARFEKAGYPVLLVSAARGTGLAAFRDALRRRTSVLMGPSGVGKSTLLNALDPALELRVGGLSPRAGRGRHTTVGARVLSIDGAGDVIDTPGFSDVGLWRVPPEELGGCFPEIRACQEECRFRSCLHRAEPDCAVKAAVEAGTVDESRYRSYLRLLEEAEGAPRR